MRLLLSRAQQPYNPFWLTEVTEAKLQQRELVCWGCCDPARCFKGVLNACHLPPATCRSLISSACSQCSLLHAHHRPACQMLPEAQAHLLLPALHAAQTLYSLPLSGVLSLCIAQALPLQGPGSPLQLLACLGLCLWC